MINFNSQALSKRQMKAIHGGKCSYICYEDGEFIGFVQANSKKEAEDAAKAHDAYIDDKVSCTEYGG